MMIMIIQQRPIQAIGNKKGETMTDYEKDFAFPALCVAGSITGALVLIALSLLF